MCCKVVYIASVSLKRISEISFTICSLVDIVNKHLVATEESLELVGVSIFVHTYTGGNKIFGFESTVCHHGEHINYIMRKAVSIIVAVFTVIFHLELPSCHLGYAVVHSLTCVDGSLQVSVFQGQHSSTCLG